MQWRKAAWDCYLFIQLAAYRHWLDNTKPDICPRCDETAENVKHWIRCPANIQDRINIFGKTDVDLGALTEEPAKALAYANCQGYISSRSCNPVTRPNTTTNEINPSLGSRTINNNKSWGSIPYRKPACGSTKSIYVVINICRSPIWIGAGGQSTYI